MAHMEPQAFSATRSQRNDHPVLVLSGELDVASSGELKRALA